MIIPEASQKIYQKQTKSRYLIYITKGSIKDVA